MNPPRTDHLEVPDGQDDPTVDRIIVVGHGRFGQIVADMLYQQDTEVVLIDDKPGQIERSQLNNIKVHYGDGTRVDLLRRAGAEEARAICYCIDKQQPQAKTLEPVIQAFPQAAILVRAFDREHLMELQGLDLQTCIREVFESAVIMGCSALDALGLNETEIDAAEEEFRQQDLERLRQQTGQEVTGNQPGF